MHADGLVDIDQPQHGEQDRDHDDSAAHTQQTGKNTRDTTCGHKHGGERQEREKFVHGVRL